MAIVNRLSWVTGGPQGSGVDTAANIFAKACALGGLYLFGKREYHSNIKGEHSYFSIHVSESPVRAHVDHIDMLVVFDAETLFRHALHVVSDGVIVYDASITGSSVDDVPTLERSKRDELRSLLSSHSLEGTVDGMLRLLESQGVRLYAIPCHDLLQDIASKRGEPSLSRLMRMVNIMMLSSSLALLEYDQQVLADAIRYVFRAKKSIADLNVDAALYTYNYTKAKYVNEDGGIRYRLVAGKPMHDMLLVQGNQSVALGKMVAGCRFQTYYPITPASDESEFLEANELLDGRGSVVVIQTEDEIAAICMAIGAGLSGTRASTSTSGPGFSLMVEALGWAGINEVPVVVTLYQRAGPSTGLPTRHEQGDLLFAIHAGHGEFPRVVIASGDVEEAFYDAVRAFNYAERYQLPVIHIVDKAIANSVVTCRAFNTTLVRIDRGMLMDTAGAAATVSDGSYLRFRFTGDGISPRVRLGTPDAVFWNTGDEHDERGHITEDPDLRVRMMDKRMGKLELVLKELSSDEQAIMHGHSSDATVISWGSTKGAILDAIDMLRARDGIEMNFVQVRLLNPFPSAVVSSMLERTRMLIDVEMNYSAQLSKLLRANLQRDADYHVVKYNGRPMSSSEVYEALKGIITGGIKSKRVVLRHGV
ncbi:MAG: 2-oxoacid:acceptor oxidoreductase subunit alpha [Candidatus Nitrosocaldus sp.]|nr:2-oxoacid:acceptor oxidoreductase subunit alpha [Candidatus Nitrosocaldus sp.]MDW7999945.1 2-oxoacid:ferredoxin oxidoreductase subunit alpha [Candidatus Nitrosocaldus sp.]